MTVYDPNYLTDTIFGLSANRESFIEELGDTIRSAIEFVLDGEESLDDLEAPEKTFIGTKFEKLSLRRFGLPRKRKGTTDLKLDTKIAGIDVDLKFTLGNNWMIPPEALNHWCMLVKVNYDELTYSCGILQMKDEHLTRGSNRDRKRSVSKVGKTNIHWLVESGPLQTNKSRW